MANLNLKQIILKVEKGNLFILKAFSILLPLSPYRFRPGYWSSREDYQCVFPESFADFY
jgi:hypothetical protein